MATIFIKGGRPSYYYAPVQQTPKEKSPEVAIGELRKQYEEKMQEQYEKTAERLRGERDEALRENWVLQQRAKAALPEQLAAAGLNGGAAESTLTKLDAEYQSDRNDIRKGYISDLAKFSEKQEEQRAENERGYNEKWLQYLMDLAEMEKKYSYEMYR